MSKYGMWRELIQDGVQMGRGGGGGGIIFCVKFLVLAK